MRATIIDNPRPRMEEMCFVMVRFDLNNFKKSTRFYSLNVHLHTNIISVALGLVLLVSITARAQEAEPKGELRIYPRPTQIGTVANRQFKDAKGRVVKVIYYMYATPSMSNFREEL